MAGLKVPFTVKIRIFDDVQRTIRFAKMLEQAGASLLTVRFSFDSTFVLMLEQAGASLLTVRFSRSSGPPFLMRTQTPIVFTSFL
jgi:hypothetical protein